MATAVVLAGTFLGTSPAQAADVGFVGPVYGTSTSAPTGQKPQSKLWVADGIWWGALFDKTSGDFHIFRYNWDANTWSDTGVLIDERSNMYMDTLWDGQYLYVLSAGATASNTAHSPRLVRFWYSSSNKTWTRSSGFPVSPMGSGGVKSPVIAKDSTGLLWATFFTGSKIYVTHSQPGDDRSWVTRYQLPTPNGESSVGTDDISAVVAFDGDKIGVLWSNQLPGTETMYWAWHQDGTSDGTWTTEVAYQQPEGADDHISLKSLVGDSSGRVFAIAKTSMDLASDPLFNLLSLNLAGQWSATKVWDKADNSTRAIVQIDSENRQVHAFAAAPCCSGGTIYHKSAPLDAPVFAPGLGTPFISSAAHPEANNPTSTKQNVNGTTNLVVMASDDQTRTYLYNRLDIGSAPPPQDTTPPETTITGAPATTTTSTTATFAFTSSESSSTFACSLDGAAAQPCSSPKSYAGLSVTGHTFAVAATDSSGNEDTTPATHSWTIEPDTTPPDTTITSAPPATTTSVRATFQFTSDEAGSTFACSLDGAAEQACTSPITYTDLALDGHTFAVRATDPSNNVDATAATHAWTVQVAELVTDDFTSGGFTAGGWRVQATGGGKATVESGAVHSGDLGARLVSTTSGGSTASIRRDFSAHERLNAAWDAKVVLDRAGQSFALAEVYSSSGRVFALVRDSSGALSVVDDSTTYTNVGTLARDQVARIAISLAQAGSADRITISIDGVQVFSSTSADLGSSAFSGIRLGDDAKRRVLDYRIDNVRVTS